LAVENILDKAREKFKIIVDDNHLLEDEILVNIGAMTPKQVIGAPSRDDYALLEGKEVMIEARFRESFGQAFTDRPVGFKGTIKEVLNLNLDFKEKRAIFISTLNSVMAHLGMVNGLRHCRDQEPEDCARQIAEYILSHYGKVKIGLIGLQPAILENLVKTFDSENIQCTDLNSKNIGSSKYGADILDGRTETTRLIMWSDMLLVTSSTLVNNSFDSIGNDALKLEKPLILFGVSGAGISALMGFERVCFFAH
jgi:uncharacterized protein (DUF4213/DUF364 family)